MPARDHFIGSFLFVAIAVFYAVVVTVLARRFGERTPMTWYVFFDRYGFCALALVMAAAELFVARARTVDDFPVEARVTAGGVLPTVNVAALFVLTREEKRRREQA